MSDDPANKHEDIRQIQLEVAADTRELDLAKAEAAKLEHTLPQRQLTWVTVAICSLVAALCLFIFLCGLSLMGSSFKVLGGRGASSMFSAADNPISGVMTGVLATVLVQSSSTSTSIVVAMVGEGALSVKMSIPIVMGANIGTTVTNTIVSMGSVGNKLHLQRAFAGATVHDMFNFLSVLTLLPIEAITAAVQGEGGVLYWMSYTITKAFMGAESGNTLSTPPSPLKVLAAPIVDNIIMANKYVIYALTLDKPQPQTPAAVNRTLCAPPPNATRRLDAEPPTASEARVLPSRRVSALEDCSRYFCVGEDLDTQFRQISKSGYKTLIECGDMILDSDGEPCGDEKCYLNAGRYYEDRVENGRLIKGGFLKAAPDVAGGIIGLALSLAFLCLGLLGLTKALQRLFLGKASSILRQATKLNGYVAIAIGFAITVLVQSSSVTTSALTPLCGLGVLPLEKMLPLTLGANIGTCTTAVLAALVSLRFAAVQIALCHLLFNLLGILIWFPIPLLRQIPLAGARLLGLYASRFSLVPPLYIVVVFVLLPMVCFGIQQAFKASLGAGLVILLLALALLGTFEYAWLVGIPRGNALCYRVLSEELREEGKRRLEEAGEAGSAAAAGPAGSDQKTAEALGAHEDAKALGADADAKLSV